MSEAERAGPASGQRVGSRMERNRPGFIGLAVLAAVAAGIALSSCRKETESAAAARTAKVEVRDIQDFLALPGILEAREQVTLKSEVSGPIDRIHVKEGDHVKKGDPILTVDPEQIRNREKRDRLSLDKSRIQYEQAKRNYENGKSLREVAGVSQQKLQDLSWAMELARIQYEGDKLALEETRLLLSKSTVLAPFDGTVVSLDVKEGEVIVAGTASVGGGTPLGVHADLSRMTVTVNVSELDYPNLRQGQAAFVSTEARPGERFPGRVEYLSKIAKEVKDKNVRSFEVRVAMDTGVAARAASGERDFRRKRDSTAAQGSRRPGTEPGKDSRAGSKESRRSRTDMEGEGGFRNSRRSRPGTGLAPGINVAVEFQMLDLKQVPALPYDLVYRATRPDQPPTFVWIKGAAGPEKKPVKTGATNYTWVQIVSGLEPGDVVVETPEKAKGEGGMNGRPPGGGGRRAR